VANFLQITQWQNDLLRSIRPSPCSHQSNQTPEWLLDAPADLDQIKYFNRRYWHFCTKCGKNGRWVCTHTDATHDDRSRSSSPSHFFCSSPTPESSEYYHRSHRFPSRHYHQDHQHSWGRWESRLRSRSPHITDYSSTSGSPTLRGIWCQLRNYPFLTPYIASLMIKRLFLAVPVVNPNQLLLSSQCLYIILVS